MPTWLRKTLDRYVKITIGVVILTGVLTVGVVWYYFTPAYTRAGYAPRQPVPFSHKKHVGQLGMSCLYCHTNVERSPHANVPSSETCMSCHKQIKANSPLLSEVRQSYESGQPVEWERIHKLPDYAYFNHSVHVNRGVSCVSCHGQINEMEVAYHAKPLSMGWCLDCHRNPEEYLRPAEEVTNLDWSPPAGVSQLELGTKLKETWNIHPRDNCQGCHR